MAKRIASLRLADTPPHRPQPSLTTHWPCRSRPMNRQEVSVAWAALIFCWMMVFLVDSRGLALPAHVARARLKRRLWLLGGRLDQQFGCQSEGQRDHQKASDVCEHICGGVGGSISLRSYRSRGRSGVSRRPPRAAGLSNRTRTSVFSISWRVLRSTA